MFTQKSARRAALLIAPVLALVALFSLGAEGTAGAKSRAERGPRPTIVLVHGDWADGSSWTSVIERLQNRGFAVVAPPNLLRGPGADSAYLASYLQTISGVGSCDRGCGRPACLVCCIGEASRGEAEASDVHARQASSSRTGRAKPLSGSSPSCTKRTPWGGAESATLWLTSTCPALAWAAIRAARLTVRPK
jgi:hypothetical protein